ncbi:MAG: D-alanyl-D-alanine carboxypeptidase, partial [Microlunatus sp.]|nr:D-alanyl-D-alanine carboxypeptidase [Microlunatus sp.]
MAGRRGKVVGALIGLTVAVSALAAAGVAGLQNAAFRIPGAAAPSSPARTGPTAPGALPAPSTAPVPQVSLDPVLAPAGTVVETDSAALAKKVSSAGRVAGARISAAVMAADTGRFLYNRGATTGLIPASVTKLLTTSAALKLLGPAHR